MIDPMDRILETTAELGDMEHIMHIRKFDRQLQLIRKISSLFQNGERTNIARGQFPFDSEAANATKGRDAEISFITNFIVNFLMMLIIVALLPRLSDQIGRASCRERVSSPV